MSWIVPRRRGYRARSVASVAVAGLALTVAGCGGEGDGDGAVTVAEARVTAKEKALADAKAELADRSAEFCDAAAGYISALDRYGDVLTQTAPTVGDVTDAGSDLEQPAEAAMADAEAAVAAQQAVADAKQELADAQAALAAAKNPGSAQPSSPSATKSPKPLAPAATVNRVKRAESELATVRQGIDDDTPLPEASQQFNAAVVALEMSWLRLFVDAGCLTDEQQVAAEAAVRTYTTSLQQSLLDAGYYAGEVDGIYGPATVEAVESLQQAHGLPVTGALDKATADALESDLAAKGGAIAQEAVASTAAVQQTLALAGFWDGPVDGKWSPELTRAFEDFQIQLGVEPTGTVDAATVAALEKAISEAGAAASIPPTESATPTTPPMSTATTSDPSATSSTG